MQLKYQHENSIISAFFHSGVVWFARAWYVSAPHPHQRNKQNNILKRLCYKVVFFLTQRLSDKLCADYYYNLPALQSADSSRQNSLEGSACLLPAEQTQKSGSSEKPSAAALLWAYSQVLILCYNPILRLTC